MPRCRCHCRSRCRCWRCHCRFTVSSLALLVLLFSLDSFLCKMFSPPALPRSASRNARRTFLFYFFFFASCCPGLPSSACCRCRCLCYCYCCRTAAAAAATAGHSQQQQQRFRHFRFAVFGLRAKIFCLSSVDFIAVLRVSRVRRNGNGNATDHGPRRAAKAANRKQQKQKIETKTKKNITK